MNFKNIGKVNYVLLDFDDTLAIHSNHDDNLDDEHLINHLASCISNEQEWDDCKASRHMQSFMDYCSIHGKRMYLTSSSPSFEIIRKLQWVKNNYHHELQDLSVCTDEQKIVAAEALATFIVNGREIASGEKLDSIDKLKIHREILIVDDKSKILKEAQQAGFSAASPMEIVDFIENLENKKYE